MKHIHSFYEVLQSKIQERIILLTNKDANMAFLLLRLCCFPYGITQQDMQHRNIRTSYYREKILYADISLTNCSYPVTETSFYVTTSFILS